MNIRINSILPVMLIICLVVFPPYGRADALWALTDNPEVDQFVDWLKGYVYVFSTGFPGEEAAHPAGKRRESLKSAWFSARNKLYSVAYSLPFDGGRIVGNVLKGESGRRAQRAFRQFISAAEPLRIFYRADLSSGIWIRAPLYGRNGLAGIEGKSSPIDGKNIQEDDQDGSPKLFVALQVISFPSIMITSLWPSIIDPGEGELFDLASLFKEGFLPPDFRIYRGKRKEIESDPAINVLDWEKTYNVTAHKKGTDYILVADMPESPKFNPYIYSGMLIIEDFRTFDQTRP